jgi:hypothetical protein
MTRASGAIPLAPETVRRLLSDAAHCRARVHLRAGGGDAEPLASGEVAGGDDTRLLVRIKHGYPAPQPLADGMPLQVSLEVGDDRYVFQTRCLTAPTAAAPRMIGLAVPASVSREDRRRSPRRRLAGATEVVLHANKVQAQWRCRAALLNLSADGLACRVNDADAATLDVGQTVCVIFRPAGAASGFDLEARVSNVTEAGTPGRRIVGLEFLHETTPPGSRARLADVLNA